jgi:hypothetical protein
VKQIAEALVKAQKGFSPALKTHTNSHFRNRYADLATCVEAVIDSLNDNQIALMQMTHECPDGVTVETVFVHSSGEMLSAGKLHVPAAKHDPQGYGSALTYARRYSLMAACGIAPEDDDGNAASKPVPKPAPKVEVKPEPKPEPKPPVVQTNQGVADFAMSMFIEFLPSAKTESELNAFWKENKDAVNKIKAYDESMYVDLLAKFKARKDEINGN